MDDFFRQGFELAEPIVGTEGSLTFPIDDVSSRDVQSFIDGVIQGFEDRSHSIAGIRHSGEFSTMVESFVGYDSSLGRYKGIPLAFTPEFWPLAKIEIVAGPRVIGNG